MKNKDYPYTKRITLGIDEETGKEVRKRIYASSVKGLPIAEYEAKQEWKLYLEQKKHAENTFGFFSKKWLQTAKGKRSIRTVKDYEYTLRKMRNFDNKLMSEIKKSDLQTIINENWEHPRTCKKIQQTLHQIFEEAVEEDLITKNPSNRLTLPVYIKEKKEPLKKEELNALKKADLDVKERIFMSILFYCGLRPEEIRALQPQNIDFKEPCLIINQAITWDSNAGVLKETKNHKNRRVPIASALLPELKQYARDFKKEEWLFGKSKKEIWTQSAFTRFVSNIFEKINAQLKDGQKLQKNDLYKYRHNFCTNLYYEGVKPGKISVLKAAEISGHTVEVFLKTYCHIDDSKENVQEVINSLKF